jgi:hypothetical protein
MERGAQPVCRMLWPQTKLADVPAPAAVAFCPIKNSQYAAGTNSVEAQMNFLEQSADWGRPRNRKKI